MTDAPLNPCEPLKLIAFDAEDLAILSAHLEGATLSAADFAYLPGERRFALAARRLDWHHPEVPQRRPAGLHFERVMRARRSGFPEQGDAGLTLLAVTFAQTDAPAGEVTLHFAEGAAVRLSVECIEAQIRDLEGAWECSVADVSAEDA